MSQKSESRAVVPAVAPEAMSLSETRKELTKRPLASAPKELQHVVWRVWTCHQHLFSSPMPIAAATGIWVREFGLQIEDAREILNAFLSPARMASFKYHSDLMTEYAAMAKDAIERRKRQKPKKIVDKVETVAKSLVDSFAEGVK